LAIDPHDDVTLAEEIALQRLYLDIEKARFPDRLTVRVDVPESLEKARVPALLLQPIVENAIKHGVARTAGRVELDIRAEPAGAGLVRILIKNSGGTASDVKQKSHGTGVGLVNVCERLTARFGSAASCSFGPGAAGGYRVSITLPPSPCRWWSHDRYPADPGRRR
jgi:LytS/YehU family sensor histidine kinase